ncbi:hypothetical protein U879_18225 [Defluviimonas sp. 20V17]|uniref:DUF1223 domain-containing protein n=1 Tax=Allgaiera indica TaxID=765699 RepID=A0AAN4US89_9RHOB|nr:DUF1223 domain-containing protein [Allgaiera indica]KDB02257.1 hypothetical protein U879_18225 [Defluviimonas sp. 20V17]GHE02738.1 hypothetical protein GCM10008024_23460 [Allgaiera indica]SDX18470.1 hypothetical protein SAMN05444006_11179 [Allgaiera indica]
MYRLTGAALALVLVIAGGAGAALAAGSGTAAGSDTDKAAAATSDRQVVVELFTSQGCSSCPPADELLGRLATHRGVIALGFHVDYWDYIGWKDSFGSPAFTKRQKDYARTAGDRAVYTPQMIIQGTDRVVGFKPNEVAALIRLYRATPPIAQVTMARTGDMLTIEATAEHRFEAPALVELVRYQPMRRVKITRGENAGRAMDYHNIVTQLTRIGEWEGAGSYRAKVKIEGDDPAVLLIQAPGPGPIYGAARVD